MDKTISSIQIVAGYQPGVLARVVQLHIDYYHKHWQFGLPFEAKVATELAEFLNRYNPTDDLFLSAVDAAGETVGSVSIDAAHAGTQGAHLRWFIVAPSTQGVGLGRQLMQRAIDHCDERDLQRIYLTTFQGLSAARTLYEAFDFDLVSETKVDQWQGGVVEQRFEREKPPR